MNRRVLVSLAVFSLVLVGAVAARLLVGGPLVEQVADAILELRLLRVCVGLIVGASLAVAGVLLQSLLRNPLAGPEILGVSSGASLAVVLAMWLGGTGAMTAAGSIGATLTWQAGPALLGAISALAIVYLLSQRRGLVNPIELVLTGVVVSVLCGAGVMFVQHVSGGLLLGSARVLVGELSDDWEWPHLAAMGAIAIAGTIAAAAAGRAMDAASLGDDEAASVGVRLSRLRLCLFALAGALTAIAVTLAGPIGFVGLVCPHLARLATGMRGGHRVLVILAALSGAAMVVGGDALIKAIHLGAGRMPLGVVTALVGGPVFLLLLRRSTRMAQ